MISLVNEIPIRENRGSEPRTCWSASGPTERASVRWTTAHACPNLESFLADPERNPGDEEALEDAGRGGRKAPVHGLRRRVAGGPWRPRHRPRSILRLHTRTRDFEASPGHLIEEMRRDDSGRREVIEEVRTFVDGRTHPSNRELIVTYRSCTSRLRTCASSLRNSRLDPSTTDELGPEDPAYLGDHSDPLYVSPEPERGVLVNDEDPTASNERKRDGVSLSTANSMGLAQWLALARPSLADRTAVRQHTWTVRSTSHAEGSSVRCWTSRPGPTSS